MDEIEALLKLVSVNISDLKRVSREGGGCTPVDYQDTLTELESVESLELLPDYIEDWS